MNQPTEYDTDILLWSEHQAAVLRGLPRQHLPNDFDLENIAEEIADVGMAELAIAKSYIRQILVHLIKIASAPEADAGSNWWAEIIRFQGDLLDRVTPSMRQRIDFDILWQRAMREAEAALAIHGDRLRSDLPRTCPIALTDMLDSRFDGMHALQSIRGDIEGEPGS